MPEDLLRREDGKMRIDLDRCYLPFVEKALDVIAACRLRGQDFVPTFGFRSFREQAALRQAWIDGKGGKAAPAGESAHNFGLAWDVCCDGDHLKKGLQPSWNVKRYKMLGEESAKVGLVWGGSFGDSPHIQWPEYVSGLQMKPLRKIWEDCPDHATDAQRLSAVWQFLDAKAGR